MTNGDHRVSTLTHAEALDRAAALSEKLVARRAKTEELRRLPDETVQDFLDSGLLRINQSARWGGPELGIVAALEVVAEIAKGDASSGWVFGLFANHFWLICLFSERAQQEVWRADPSALIASAFFPTDSRCERVPGGYRVRGRWPWASGSNHSAWAMIGISIPPTSDNAPPQYRWALVPRSDYRVDDDWQTIAMRGTG